MPTLLALYPGSGRSRRQTVRAHRAWLTERGIRVVLADDAISPEDAGVFDGVVEIPPAAQVRASFRALEAWCRGHRVDAVLVQSEEALMAGALLLGVFGLPGVGLEAAFRCADKLATRQTLFAAGVPQPRFTVGSEAADVARFAEEIAGWPVVLKGVTSALGRLVTPVAGPSEAPSAVARVRAGLAVSKDIDRLEQFTALASLDPGCDPRRQFLIEAYAAGDPVETDGFRAGGETAFYGVTGQVMTPAPLFYIEGYLLPAERPAEELAAIERVSAAALEALGVRDAGFSIELRAGRDGPRLIEVNPRLGEDDGFADLFRAAAGAPSFEAAVELALGMRPRIRRPDAAWALAYQCILRDGSVARLPAPEEFARLEREGIRAGTSYEQGEATHAPPSPLVYPHLAWALADDPRSSRAAYARARRAVDSLRFEIAAR